MRATLHFSLLAATLSPSLVHSSPIPFVPNYNSSPRSSAQALSESSRPGGVFSTRSPLTHGGSAGHGLGLLDLGSNSGGNGGDASSGSSYAHGGGYGSKEDDHPTDDGGQPVIDLGPINDTSDQPQPDHAGNDADPKPDTYGPGEPVSPPRKPDTGIDPNVDNNPPEGSTPEKYPNPDESTPPSPKSAPDPANGEGRPYIPVFLGPSNNDPSHGSSHPPYDASHDSDHPSDGGRDRYTDDYPCGGPFGESLINVLSNNGGDGGDASSGSATSIEYGGDGSSSAYSGAGGNASGGSVYAAPALVNILSDNGGDGGNAASGDSYSVGKRHGSASYSGAGGNASGGSVKVHCPRRREVSRTLADSETSRNTLTRPRSGGSLLALQRKWDDTFAAYSGMRGDALRTNPRDGHSLIDFWSDGSDASSGDAYGHGPKTYSGSSGNAAAGDAGRRALINVRTGETTLYLRFSARARAEYDPAHSGAGKPASEHSTKHHVHEGLVNAGSGNGGEGGDGRSGDAYAVLYGATPHSGSGYERAVKRDGHDREHSGAEAHSGPGGNASGGNVKGDGGLINILSGNGGDGGDASSGSAFAYGKDAKAYSGPGGNASGGSVNHEMERKPGYGYGRRSNGIIDVASSVYS